MEGKLESASLPHQDSGLSLTAARDKRAILTKQWLSGQGGFESTAYRLFCPQKILINKRGNIKGTSARQQQFQYSIPGKEYAVTFKQLNMANSKM